MATRYLLDTNICIYIAKYNPLSVRERFAQHAANELAMSVITLGELRFGAEKSQSKARAMAVIDELANLMNIEVLSDSVAEHYGEIRASLQKSGQMIGNNDLWLAAHARARDWILVTNNEKEFVRVEGLRVENWV
ncbi:type II toxin-antitoxin system tRNA(fMet)-specific endonuclease VapC [Cellvibrio sp. OA-2007]|uniref:type II toxin-antitoxin system tRNA(fMet)-specific endonuclease VapC n=1 Tax=Cellvibrio sp. OA-2007 TaxID=529823 RepID=UPI000786020A|nr:type II toxin-antitoxin system VapC family toxin [Cellvibrio sp. OA-2007]